MTWWIATTAPSLEFRAAGDIAKIGLDAWLPIRTVEIRNRRRTGPSRKRDYPLCPGYLFVQAFSSDWREDWHAMRAARGVSGILANGGLPLAVSDGTMDAFRRRHEAPFIPVVQDAYRIGEAIRIVDQGSSFCGLEGEVEACDRQTVRILLDIFGRKSRVEIMGDRLERVA